MAKFFALLMLALAFSLDAQSQRLNSVLEADLVVLEADPAVSVTTSEEDSGLDSSSSLQLLEDSVTDRQEVALPSELVLVSPIRDPTGSESVSVSEAPSTLRSDLKPSVKEPLPLSTENKSIICDSIVIEFVSS